MATTRTATTRWHGQYRGGLGDVVFDSSGLGAFPVVAAVQQEGPPSVTTPMELLAAAYSSCVCITAAYELGRLGYLTQELETSSEVTLDHREGITGIHITVHGDVLDMSQEEFASVVAAAEVSCPVGRALSSVKVVVDAELRSIRGSGS